MSNCQKGDQNIFEFINNWPKLQNFPFFPKFFNMLVKVRSTVVRSSWNLEVLQNQASRRHYVVPFRCHFVVWPKQEMNGDLRSQSSSGCPEWPRLPILTSRRRWSELGLLPEFPGKKRASQIPVHVPHHKKMYVLTYYSQKSTSTHCFFTRLNLKKMGPL